MKPRVMWLCLALVAPAGAVELGTALRAAEHRDPALAAARASRDAALENVPLNRGRLLPQVTLQASAQRINQETTQSTVLGETTSKFIGPAHNVQLALRQGLYRPRDRLGVAIGELQAEVGEHKLSTAWSELWLRTVQAWLEVLAAESQREALGEAAAAAERMQAQARKRLEQGDGTRDAVAEADAQAAAARATFRDAEIALALRQRNFSLLTGLAGVAVDRWRLPGERLPALPVSHEAEWLDRVLSRNAELQAAVAALAIGEKRLAQASVDHRPSLDLVASATQSRNDSASSLGSSYLIGQVGLQFSVPIFTGGTLSAAERQAAAFVQVAAAERDTYEQALRQRVAALWGGQLGQRERVAAAIELVAAAREQLHAAELGLRHGLRSVADVGNAAALLANRRRELAELRLGVLVSQAQLLALLPTDDPAWTGWTGELEALARLP